MHLIKKYIHKELKANIFFFWYALQLNYLHFNLKDLVIKLMSQSTGDYPVLFCFISSS